MRSTGRPGLDRLVARPAGRRRGRGSRAHPSRSATRLASGDLTAKLAEALLPGGRARQRRDGRVVRLVVQVQTGVGRLAEHQRGAGGVPRRGQARRLEQHPVCDRRSSGELLDLARRDREARRAGRRRHTPRLHRPRAPLRVQPGPRARPAALQAPGGEHGRTAWGRAAPRLRMRLTRRTTPRAERSDRRCSRARPRHPRRAPSPPLRGATPPLPDRGRQGRRRVRRGLGGAPRGPRSDTAPSGRAGGPEADRRQADPDEAGVLRRLQVGRATAPAARARRRSPRRPRCCWPRARGAPRRLPRRAPRPAPRRRPRDGRRAEPARPGPAPAGRLLGAEPSRELEQRQRVPAGQGVEPRGRLLAGHAVQREKLAGGFARQAGKVDRTQSGGVEVPALADPRRHDHGDALRLQPADGEPTASADSASSHCASSSATRSGVSSAAAASRLSVAAPTVSLSAAGRRPARAPPGARPPAAGELVDPREQRSRHLEESPERHLGL